MIRWLAGRFRNAFRGIRYGLTQDKSIRLQIALAILIINICFFFGISRNEWIAILFCIGMVLVTEMINSAIENCVDYISADYHEIAGRIKDLAAGAVLVASIAAAMIGILVLFPYVERFILSYF